MRTRLTYAGFTKRALIRDGDAPAGQPAAMHIECLCRTTLPVPAPFTAARVICAHCGQHYDSRGFLIQEE